MTPERPATPESEFVALAERHRGVLRLHCYRMTGSVEDAEELVQETLLRAWRGRDGFEGRSTLRTWLLRIATNAALSRLARAPRRVLPLDLAAPVTADTPASEAREQPPWSPELPWLEPLPDRLLDQDPLPDEALVTRQSVGLAYLAALQRLSPRPRAVLVLREALELPAREVAELLGLSIPAVNSALQRARATLRRWGPPVAPPDEREREVVDHFVAAWEQGDSDALVRLMRKDARWSMPPAPLWFAGRDAIARLYERFPISRLGTFRTVVTAANRQPAVATYLTRPGEAASALVSVHLLQIEAGEVAEVVTFAPTMCGRFGLPTAL
ncbi:MAG: RNA polymerase subunit sigma-70 [Myxococcota bacterium]